MLCLHMHKFSKQISFRALNYIHNGRILRITAYLGWSFSFLSFIFGKFLLYFFFFFHFIPFSFWWLILQNYTVHCCYCWLKILKFKGIVFYCYCLFRIWSLLANPVLSSGIYLASCRCSIWCFSTVNLHS